jgi:hypothetical protein
MLFKELEQGDIFVINDEPETKLVRKDFNIGTWQCNAESVVRNEKGYFDTYTIEDEVEVQKDAS